MSELALPRPDNLRGPGILVTSDVYHIAERVKEIDPNLYIYLLDPPQPFADKVFRYAICEMCADRVERLVYRVEELDARILKHLTYLLHVPFEQRFAEAERLADESEAEAKDEALTELYERMGRPMWTQLEHDGFIQRPVSFPKRGVKAA